jgi:DNA-binding response OmpR family regulator
MRVLLVSLPRPQADPIAERLSESGGVGDMAANSSEGYRRAKKTDYDAVLLGLAPPPTDDVSVVRRWRRQCVNTGILALTPRPDVAQTIRAIDSGADDCVAVPFHVDEVVARLRALARRQPTVKEDPVIRIGDLEIDVGARCARREGRYIRLTPREYELLRLLALHRGRVVSRRMIWDCLYDEGGDCGSNVVDVYIRYLRRKIDGGFAERLIVTHWGEGYRLRNEAG